MTIRKLPIHSVAKLEETLETIDHNFAEIAETARHNNQAIVRILKSFHRAVNDHGRRLLVLQILVLVCLCLSVWNAWTVSHLPHPVVETVLRAAP